MTSRNVRGRADVVVTPHDSATAAGIELFALGGSAVDAAVAANAVQGVVAPETCGVGGDLFALVWEPGMEMPATLDASGWAGSMADAAELAGHETIPWDHPLTVTIPGCVAGWAALHRRFGRVPLATVLAPAIRLAERGFAVSEELSDTLRRLDGVLAKQPSGVDLFPAGEPPPVGASVTRPLLATTLSDIAVDGAEAFYGGRPAMAISEALDGRITRNDLAEYRPEWTEPLRLDVFGRTGWTMPPASQGYLTLATLGVFERLDPPPADDPLWTHLLIEAYRSMAWERDLSLADRRHAPEQWAMLLDSDRLDERAARIDRSAANLWPRPAPRPAGTAYMCAIGADGQAISLIQSNFMGVGSAIGAGACGFFLHNRGAGFVLEEGHPNRLAPLRRPMHTLSPTLWTVDGRLDTLLGTRGGHQQPQLLAQAAAWMFSGGLDPASAQDRPRWAVAEVAAGAESKVMIEGDMAAGTIRELGARGHAVEAVGSRHRGWGPVSTVVVDETGLRTAAADPRVETAVAAAR